MEVLEVPDFQLERFLPYRFNVLADLLSRSLAAIYQERFGISVPEWRILATLGREAPLSAGEVGARTRMEKARVSRALTRLVENGLVNRQADPRDNRVAVLRLSRRGQSLYRRIVPLAKAWERELLAGLPAETLQALDQALDLLQTRLLLLRAGEEPDNAAD
ncbi:MAG TPA: MarR family transcriptional regulator [Candidatus Competibacteraceae bacterium]|nr:MarR family transcriptional regulator [Candidatus Competibacteraceae bacterium]